MHKIETFLKVVSQRGEQSKPLNRVYRRVRMPETLLRAYLKLQKNQGVTTVGADPEDTVDGMSLKRIEELAEKLKAGSYQWRPARRVYVPKADGRQRPISIPSNSKFEIEAKNGCQKEEKVLR